MHRWSGAIVGGVTATLLLLSGCQLIPGMTQDPPAPTPTVDLPAQLTLEPRPPAAADEALAERVRARVAALDVSQSAVEDGNGVIQIRVQQADLAKVEDYFRQPPAFGLRPVLASTDSATNPTGAAITPGSPVEPPFSLEQVDCARPAAPSVPADQTVALCNPGTNAVVAAAASVLSGERITAVELMAGNSGDGFVQITLDEEGARTVESATEALAALPPPQNILAVVIDAQVISAPTVLEAISGGVLQIQGDFTVGDARAMARRIELAATLPVEVA